MIVTGLVLFIFFLASGYMYFVWIQTVDTLIYNVSERTF